MKNPTIAILLNIIPGLGYLYLGRKRLFAALILASIPLAVFAALDPALAEYYESDYRIWDLANLLSLVLLTAAFMLDAYNEAVSVNRRK